MAQVPFQFGALDEFSRRAVSQQMAFQQMASAANGYLAQLQAANEADTAPKVDLPEMRGANLTQGLGAILQNIVDPGAAERFAAQEAQVRQFNAQVQAQEALQNQVQEGYLQRRRQERQELMAKLSADTEATKARLEASLRELGIERDVQTAKAKADAIGKQREQDLLMNSKWLAEHGASFQQALAMARLGVNAMGQPLSEDERELAKGDLARIASSAPPGELRDQLMRDIAALDAFDEARKQAALEAAQMESQAAEPPPSGGRFGAGLIKRAGLSTPMRLLFGERTSEDVAAEVEQVMQGLADTEAIRGLLDTEIPTPRGAVQPDIPGMGLLPALPPSVQTDIFQSFKVNKAIGQEAPTRR